MVSTSPPTAWKSSICGGLHGRQPGFRRARLTRDRQHVAGHTPQPHCESDQLDHPTPRWRVPGCGSRRAPQPLQGAVGRIMNIRGYNRGVDEKSAPVRNPARLATSK
jgi:hypothetical protein